MFERYTNKKEVGEERGNKTASPAVTHHRGILSQIIHTVFNIANIFMFRIIVSNGAQSNL